jgi:hypothetical protein
MRKLLRIALTLLLESVVVYAGAISFTFIFSNHYSGKLLSDNSHIREHRCRIPDNNRETEQVGSLHSDVGISSASPACLGIISGTVTDLLTGLPLQNAEVTAFGSGSNALTNAQGLYSIAVDTGLIYNLIISKFGYDTAYINGISVSQCISYIHNAQLSIVTYAPSCANALVNQDDSLIAVLSDDELEYWVVNLDPGNYCYKVSAVYDLAQFGFPGQSGESNREGPECVEIAFGYDLPFLEEWTSGQFNLNQWTAGENWVIDGQEGIPPPCAKFQWEPVMDNYNSSLESYWLNATGLDSTVLHSIWLDFQLKLDDWTAGGTEILRTEVWNGTAWITAESDTNHGNTDWQRKHLDITSLSDMRVFKIRFTAAGQHTANIHNWYVDSIRVYCEYQLLPPMNLVAQRCSFEDGCIKLDWLPPTGGLQNPHFVLDDGSAENGVYLNNTSNMWLGNEFFSTESGFLYKAMIWMEDYGGSAVYSFDVFDSNRLLIGSSGIFIPDYGTWTSVDLPDIQFSGSVFIMLHIDASTSSDVINLDEDGPNSSFNYEWVYDGTIWSKLTDYGFAPSVMLIRAEASAASTSTVPLYNIYRCQYVQPFPWPLNLEISDWELVNTVDDTEYVDDNLECNCYFYKVTALYSVGESDSTNLDYEWSCEIGVKEFPASGLVLHPNPASRYVSIDHSDKISHLEVLNKLGISVRSFSGEFSDTFTFDVSALPCDMYFVKITLKDNSTITSRLVVVH